MKLVLPIFLLVFGLSHAQAQTNYEPVTPAADAVNGYMFKLLAGASNLPASKATAPATTVAKVIDDQVQVSLMYQFPARPLSKTARQREEAKQYFLTNGSTEKVEAFNLKYKTKR